MTKAFQLHIDDEGLAHLTFDLEGEKVNKFTPPVWEELDGILDQIKNNKQIKALLIKSGKEDSFCAGADIKQFLPLMNNSQGVSKMTTQGHEVLNKLESLPFPSIAFIHGVCLGGGMEFALACTFRAVTDHPKTILGLPEVTLGIFPAWGGSQRMPRLVGLIEGITLITSGKTIPAIKAMKIHLADDVLTPAFFQEGMLAFTRKILSPEGRKKVLEKRKRGFSNALMESWPIAKAVVLPKARSEIMRKSKGHYPAPLIALDLIERSYWSSLKDGLEMEKQTIVKKFPELAPNAKQLIRLFFTSEAVKKDKGVPEVTPVTQVLKAAVLGAGTMGGGISWLFANKGISVRMKDINWDAISKGYASVFEILSQLVKIKKIKPAEATLRLHHVTGTIDYSGFQDADLVIEAATENLDLKRKIFAELEEHVSDRAIIATNTSSLTLAEMESALKHPERFVGMHFFNPVNRMPLVEVVVGKHTSDTALATAVETAKKLGKTPIVVRDCPGFVVNRVFIPGANEIMRMLEQGAGFNRLEKVMLNFGMPMSPFELADEVGNDVCYKVSNIFFNAYGKRMEFPKIVTDMYEHKLLGKKTGAGFYIYSGKEKKRNPEASKLFEHLGGKGDLITDTDIRDRVFLTMVNEASRCLQEKIIEQPAYLDLAMIMGIGFPPFRGGILAYADSLGIPYVIERLRHFEHLEGERFTPSDYLIAMHRENKTFYPRQ